MRCSKIKQQQRPTHEQRPGMAWAWSRSRGRLVSEPVGGREKRLGKHNEHDHVSEEPAGVLPTHTPTQSVGGQIQGYPWVHHLQIPQYRTDQPLAMRSMCLVARGLTTFRQKGPVRHVGDVSRGDLSERGVCSHSPPRADPRADLLTVLWATP